MATESVEILIEADNRASAKFKQLNKDAEASAKQFKEVGGKAKASTELVGSLAASIGGTGVGGFAGELAQLTERMSAFSEVSKAGGAGALAFKAGLAAAVGVIAFKVGNAIGNLVFQTEKWNEELRESTELSKALASQVASGTSRRYSEDLSDIQGIADLEERRAAAAEKQQALSLDIAGKQATIQSLTKEIESRTENWNTTLYKVSGNYRGHTRMLEEQLVEAKAFMEVAKQQNQELLEIKVGERDRLEALKDQARAQEVLQEKSEDFVQGLRDELELLRATKDERFAIEAARGTANNDDRGEAERLLRERDAIMAKQEAEKAAEADRKRASEARQREAEAEANRLVTARQGIIDKLNQEAVALKDGKIAGEAYALTLKGFDKATANKIAEAQALLGKQSRDINIGVNATQGRLITRGRAESIASKTERNTAELVKDMKRVAAHLEKQQPQKIELKQGNV